MLDLQQWLARFLSRYTGTLITVSHDDALLEGVKLSVVAEVANQRVEVFKGCGYKKFLVEREERMKWVALLTREKNHTCSVEESTTFGNRFCKL